MRWHSWRVGGDGISQQQQQVTIMDAASDLSIRKHQQKGCAFKKMTTLKRGRRKIDFRRNKNGSRRGVSSEQVQKGNSSVVYPPAFCIYYLDVYRRSGASFRQLGRVHNKKRTWLFPTIFVRRWRATLLPSIAKLVPTFLGVSGPRFLIFHGRSFSLLMIKKPIAVKTSAECWHRLIESVFIGFSSGNGSSSSVQINLPAEKSSSSTRWGY